jgi:hypothetical protein
VRHVVLIGIAASALVIGAGAFVWKKFHSNCPTKAEMADILLAIDSGRTGKDEAAAMAMRFDGQRCADAARAVRAMLAKKYPGPSAMGGASTVTYWPDTDPKCAAIIRSLPRTMRTNPTGGAALPSFYDIAMAAAMGSDPRALRNVADLFDSAAASYGKTVFTDAANCLRARADTFTTPGITYAGTPTTERPASAPKLIATLGHRSVPARFAAVAAARAPRPPPRSK